MTTPLCLPGVGAGQEGAAPQVLRQTSLCSHSMGHGNCVPEAPAQDVWPSLLRHRHAWPCCPFLQVSRGPRPRWETGPPEARGRLGWALAWTGASPWGGILAPSPRRPPLRLHCLRGVSHFAGVGWGLPERGPQGNGAPGLLLLPWGRCPQRSEGPAVPVPDWNIRLASGLGLCCCSHPRERGSRMQRGLGELAAGRPARGQAAGVLARCQGRCCQEGLGRELGVQGGVGRGWALGRGPGRVWRGRAFISRGLGCLIWIRDRDRFWFTEQGPSTSVLLTPRSGLFPGCVRPVHGRVSRHPWPRHLMETIASAPKCDKTSPEVCREG